jgi:hypothetical protein
MNLRSYFQKMREVEQSLREPFVVVASQETSDGGKRGLLTEVPKHLAARMIADGRACLASEEESRDFHEKKTEAKRLSDQESIASRMQVTLVPTAELKKASRLSKE